MASNTHEDSQIAPADSDASASTTADLLVLLNDDWGSPEEVNIAELVQLHPNALAQLDAAFKRHHWLVTTSGAGALLNRHSRLTSRGRRRENVDGATFYALMLTAIFATQQATVEQMYAVTRTLPLKTRLEYGFATTTGGRLIEKLSRKDLHNINGAIGTHLDPVRIPLTKAEQDPPEEARAQVIATRRTERLAALAEIRTSMLRATHLVAIDHGTYAIDDTAIWGWRKATRTAPAEVDVPSRPLSDEDTHMPGTAQRGEDPTKHAATDTPDLVIDGRTRTDAAWGVKTGKNGKDTSFSGYKAHVIVNTNDPKRRDALPILI
ncbi:hypothetical protein [Nocardioides sp. P86]|uniref:hypothetical protein n=1 Tax=Nocardioides sp. P86 TaxID=2939569 RepID=UPI00203BF623|nr:hypothetical protein [Nocardioides sp. P86]MCM3516247.1 hypothetical protein [Nocardioides sp. P86]